MAQIPEEPQQDPDHVGEDHPTGTRSGGFQINPAVLGAIDRAARDGGVNSTVARAGQKIAADHNASISKALRSAMPRHSRMFDALSTQLANTAKLAMFDWSSQLARTASLGMLGALQADLARTAKLGMVGMAATEFDRSAMLGLAGTDFASFAKVANIGMMDAVRADLTRSSRLGILDSVGADFARSANLGMIGAAAKLTESPALGVLGAAAALSKSATAGILSATAAQFSQPLALSMLDALGAQFAASTFPGAALRDATAVAAGNVSTMLRAVDSLVDAEAGTAAIEQAMEMLDAGAAAVADALDPVGVTLPDWEQLWEIMVEGLERGTTPEEVAEEVKARAPFFADFLPNLRTGGGQMALISLMVTILFAVLTRCAPVGAAPAPAPPVNNIQINQQIIVEAPLDEDARRPGKDGPRDEMRDRDKPVTPEGH